MTRKGDTDHYKGVIIRGAAPYLLSLSSICWQRDKRSPVDKGRRATIGLSLSSTPLLSSLTFIVILHHHHPLLAKGQEEEKIRGGGQPSVFRYLQRHCYLH